MLIFGLAARAAESVPAEPVATVHREGNKLSIDVLMNVPASLPIVWEVLTDFGQMARFVPNLHASDVQAEAPNELLVKQKGTARWGPLSFDFESVRRVRLHPMSRIDSTTLSGKISKMHSVCELKAAEGGVHVHYHADAEIDFWLPPLIGTSALRQEMEEQFGAMRNEILRRHSGH